MKSPLWILNSALAILLLGLLLFISFSRPQRAAKASLVPSHTESEAKLETPSIDPSLIYKNDLFGTYIESRPPVEEQSVKKTIVPPPPTLKKTVVTQPLPPQFLPPLAVTLKGIIYSQDESDNRAIISDNKTKKETLYKIGAKVLDAEIIHISNNKIMFIRSNGQQETLFVTQGDAQADPIYNQHHIVETVTQKISDTQYTLYQEAFAQRVHNLAQFMDMLDITTAFHQGKIIGIRIGRIEDSSLGTLLGFMQGDIVTAINGTPTTTTKNRVAIYNTLKDVDHDTTISVDVMRQGNKITLQYLVKATKRPTEKSVQTGNEEISENKQENAMNNTMVPKESAPTESVPVSLPNLQQVQKRDKNAMFNHGGRASLLQQTQS
jgi:type II secretion system protein C